MQVHVHEEDFDTSVDKLFQLLMTPSAVRQWWSAARAIIMPRAGGVWAAAWGSDEDHPDYQSTARIEVLDPPHRLVLTDYDYDSSHGPLPFEADFVTEFTVEATAEGARLRVKQEGFPEGPAGDEFLQACEQGWKDTFAGIRRYLAASS